MLQTAHTALRTSRFVVSTKRTAQYDAVVTIDTNSPPPAAADDTRRMLALFIVLFWAAQYGLMTAQRFAFVEKETVAVLFPRFLVSLWAIGLSFGIAFILVWARRTSPRARLAITVALAIAGTLLHALANFTIFQFFMPTESDSWEIAMSYIASLTYWFWSYAAVAGMIYALLSHFEAREREREISRLQRIAGDAQLRALRYQRNPHFMFNTLNSVTALISAGHASAAEEMVENLADFLRAGLSLDALEDITIKREIELQSLYLAIEKVRFVDRLRVREEVSREASRALVPSLVTQPLIENAIRHGVAVTAEPVDLIISAHVEKGELHVAVRNTAPAKPREDKRGTSVGLINVEERLRARFGADVRFAAGLESDGMYAVRFVVPRVFAGEAR